jgi:F-type H+-transporting ATPase subunit delta
MKTTASQYAQALHELSKETSAADQSKMAADFLYLMRRKGESKKLARIVKKLEQLQDAQSQTKQVSVTTAFPVSDELAKSLEVFAKEVFESPSVVMNMRTDSALLGGVVMKTDNQMVNASVAGNMKDMRKTFSV